MAKVRQFLAFLCVIALLAGIERTSVSPAFAAVGIDPEAETTDEAQNELPEEAAGENDPEEPAENTEKPDSVPDKAEEEPVFPEKIPAMEGGEEVLIPEEEPQEGADFAVPATENPDSDTAEEAQEASDQPVSEAENPETEETPEDDGNDGENADIPESPEVNAPDPIPDENTDDFIPGEEENAEELPEMTEEDALSIGIRPNGRKVTVNIGPEPVTVLLHALEEGRINLFVENAPGLEVLFDGQRIAPGTAGNSQISVFEVSVSRGTHRIALYLPEKASVGLRAVKILPEEDNPVNAPKKPGKTDSPEKPDENNPEEEDGQEENAGPKPETEAAEAEQEEVPEDEPDSEEPEEQNEMPLRSVSYDVTFGEGAPVMGGTAHFTAILEGFEDVGYVITWQVSPDDENWTDLDEHGTQMDVVITEENSRLYWRVKVETPEDTDP